MSINHILTPVAIHPLTGVMSTYFLAITCVIIIKSPSIVKDFFFRLKDPQKDLEANMNSINKKTEE